MAKKPSLGRQKIAIAKIKKKNHLQVTFSKRRSGLFKKASELCTLCGVEIAILVYSPAHKAFTFGHPEVDSILDRFLTCGNPVDFKTRQFFEAHRNSSIRDMNIILAHIMDQLDTEKKRGIELDWARKNMSQYWWERPIEEINSVNELEQLSSSLNELKKSVILQSAELMMDPASLMVPFSGSDCNTRYNFGDQIEKKLNVEQVDNNLTSFVQYFNFPQDNGLF